MYFVLAHQPISLLPYHCQINDLYLSTSEKIDTITLFGYKLNEYGGNYVEFDLTHSDGLTINFSFYKDFKLGLSPVKEIIFTNLPTLITETLPSSITSITLDKHSIIPKYYNVKEFLNPATTISYSDLLIQIEKQLLVNLKWCLSIGNKIVYSGGLDSSTMAFLAHYNNLEFSVLVSKEYSKYWQLPFNHVIEVDQLLSNPIGTVDLYNNIKESFYQKENNYAINGYYGDLSLLHQSELFYQCKHLIQIDVNLYDQTEPTKFNLINSEKGLRATILKLHLQPWFRHWFGNFQILDPYRDPALVTSVLQLNISDLIEQLGSAKLQKDLIRKWNPNWLDLICDYKNNYEKFKQ